LILNDKAYLVTTSETKNSRGILEKSEASRTDIACSVQDMTGAELRHLVGPSVESDFLKVYTNHSMDFLGHGNKKTKVEWKDRTYRIHKYYARRLVTGIYKFIMVLEGK
jgi:hypothetical protein